MDEAAAPTLASVVVVPDLAPASPPSRPASPAQANGNPQSLKRRASELESAHSGRGSRSPSSSDDPYTKRARLSASRENSTWSSERHADSASADAARRSPPPARRRPAPADLEADRKRGRRLFGSLLGTLSQTGGATTAAQQRRLEVERRQRERVAEQQRRAGVERPGSKQRTDEEMEALRRERAAHQQRWDAEQRKVKHASMRAQAKFLRTATEPRLFWLPFEMTNGEEEQVKQQQAAVEHDIEQELAVVSRHDDERNDDKDMTDAQQDGSVSDPAEQRLDAQPNGTNGERDNVTGTDKTNHSNDAASPTAQTEEQKPQAPLPQSDTRQNGEQESKDDDDEDMVLNGDAEEDPVIY